LAESKRSVPVPVQYKPTVYKNSTKASDTLTWWDSNNVRFVDGRPRKIGGWVKFTKMSVTGVPRSLFYWSALDGSSRMSMGTNSKYYVVRAGSPEDATPLRRTANPLGASPIATSSGLSTIVVTDTAHGADVGDYVTLSGATAVGGIGTGSLNKEFLIIAATTNTWTADTGTAAGSNTTGGGSSVKAEYQITVGLSSAVVGTGWGAGGWGRGTWGSSSTTTAQGTNLRLWSDDAWGEDLVFNPRGGAIYYYTTGSPGTRAVNLSALPGASDTPVVADQILMAGAVRIMIAFGTNKIGSSTATPMFWRWCDLEDIADWTPTTTNASGDNIFPVGSIHMQALRVRRGIAAFSDKALYFIQFVGGEDVFSFDMVSDKISIISPRAAIFAGDKLFWMGRYNWSIYDGRVTELDCGLRDYVLKDINTSQAWKIHAASNVNQNEVMWFYCSAASSEIDRYVCYNYKDNTWVPGTISRLAWVDNAGSLSLPRGVDSSGYIYDHETGTDDGSTTPPSAITAFIEGSSVALGDGYEAGFLRSLWPDLSFAGSTAETPSATLTVKMSDKPGSADHATKSVVVSRVTSSPESVTPKLDIGKRGRFASFRIESSGIGVTWSLGLPRILATTDGRR